ncbi:MAG: SUMF1/EgtB/PvdO family nonheme iron enzyme [Deltaproteobacteria bacterium]|nr:SUMF1/EgtB/PvdO family nonheme iron enzyme [Deltaproteobacteria bacterium]
MTALPSPRTRSLLASMGAGLVLGLGGLAVIQEFWAAPAGSTARVAAPPSSTGAARATATGAGTASVSASAPGPTARPTVDPGQACAQDMVLVEGHFCPALRYVCAEYVDDKEYSCAEYARGQRCQVASDYRRYCIDRHEWPNQVGQKPLVYVNWNQAKDLCASAGKRLCRRSEWVLACEGPKRLPYPWGFVRHPSPCNIDRSILPFDALALERTESREEELARLWQADPIGSHPDCVSAYGVYDMTGNVDEWTDNLADNPGTHKPSTLNGGYWGPVRDTCRLTTKSHGPRFRFYQVGFRCCRDTADGVPVPPPRPWIESEDEKDAGAPEPEAPAADPYDELEAEP